MTTQTATLVEKRSLSSEIADFRFELGTGHFFGLEAGAHIDVKLGDTLVRQYSIWDWDPAGSWLNVAVKREDTGRGGSLAMHALEVGAQVEISGPRNHFKLHNNDGHKTLIAGGIGVTPIFAMTRQLRNRDADFRVIYMVRSKELAALHSEFIRLDLGDRYQFHCDDTDGWLDLPELMQSMPMGGDIYTCGPESMLNTVLEAGSELRGGSIHFERFVAASDITHDPNGAFDIEIESTGTVLTVGSDETILCVLQHNGFNVDFGCSEGLCGSCMIDVAEGEIDHRDGVLSPEEQASNEFMCVCVSRAKSKKLVLKL